VISKLMGPLVPTRRVTGFIVIPLQHASIPRTREGHDLLVRQVDRITSGLCELRLDLSSFFRVAALRFP
jgi:hypothetical protein